MGFKVHLRSTLIRFVPFIVAAIIGCDSPSDPVEQQHTELTALYERAVTLHDELNRASELSLPLQDALSELIADFRDFEERYDRDDILMREAPGALPLASSELAIDPGQPSPAQCKGPCPPSTWHSANRLCFLTSMECDDDGRNTVCYYHFCINIPTWFPR